MVDKTNPATIDERTTLQKIDFVVTRAAPAAIAILFIFYFLNFYDGVKDQSSFGAFGDYFGGILNPILSFLTIIILVYATRLQAKELELTRGELRETKSIHRDNLKLQKEVLQEQSNQHALKVLSEKLEVHASKFMEIVNQPLLLPPEPVHAKRGKHLVNLLSISKKSGRYIELLDDADLNEYIRSVSLFTEMASLTMSNAARDLRQVSKLNIPATHIPDQLLMRPLSMMHVVENGLRLLDERSNQRPGLNSTTYGEFTGVLHELGKAKQLLTYEYNDVRHRQLAIYQENDRG
ncbi:hypothetical protein [Pseudoalteromonas sp. R3]|uniref:hypothetical protein n=1 Tax=Pseudoalteromonas sp. R3 TaxID=1709477 RepID=UPI0006B530A6|nr:hypothetical protein [Pseudoalteromonas sp. R3]AZZ98737.1 hypothetical protein ELR70_17525 [Pseudoalteromonas sp. R3]